MNLETQAVLVERVEAAPDIAALTGLQNVSEQENEAAGQKFVRDVIFSNVPIPFQKARTYLWLLILTRALGPQGFGAWSLFVVTLSSATTVSTLNCGSSLMRFLNGERERREVNQAFTTVMTMVGGASVILAILFVCFSKPIGRIIFRAAHEHQFIMVLALALVFDSFFEEMKNLLRARRLNQSWAFFSLARLAPETVAVIAIALWLRSVTAVSWTYLAVGACSVGGGILYFAIRYEFRFVKPNWHLFVKYALYGLPLLPGVLASTVSLGADKYLVSYYLGLQQVGIYSVCFAVSTLAFFLTGPINDVLFPELSALFDLEQGESFRRRFAGVQKFVFAFAVGAAALLAAFPHDALRLVASRGFASGSATLAILGVQGIFMAVVLLYVVILNVRMHVWSSTIFWLLSGAAIVAIDIELLPRLGIVGAAVSQLIVTAAGAFVLIGMHWDLFRRTFSPAWLWQIGVAFAVVYAISILWRGGSGGLAWAILGIGAGACSFLFCLFLTRYVSWSDVKLLRNAIF
ncbi:MAG: lipopolysaccharide biosynthesis protein [Candidatus Acidiferrales bacterium]